jgi:hypothetical protein
VRDFAAALLNFSVSFLPVTAMLVSAALIAAVVVYIVFRVSPDGSRRSVVRFASVGLLVGIGAGVAGTGLGIAFFCSNSLGNLCGLGGVFLSGPMAFVLALAAYLYYWARNNTTGVV